MQDKRSFMIPRFVQRFAGAEMTAREALARVCTLVVKKMFIFVIEIDLLPSLDIATTAYDASVRLMVS